MSCYLKLIKVEGAGAILEAGWDCPEKQAVEYKIVQYNAALTSENYYGDKDLARRSLDTMLCCKEALEKADDLRINVVYLSPSE
jgi:hypothetical protein